MESRKKRWLIPVLLACIFGLLTGGAYTYWAGTVSNPAAHNDSETVVIGQGQNVTTELDVTKALASQGKKLVPAGKTGVSIGGTSENVESFDVTYTVKWQEPDSADVIDASDNVTGTLAVTETHEIEGAAEHNGLVGVEVTPTSTQIKADGESVTVTVKVTLAEPATKAAYDAIVGQNIKVNLTFAVTQP
ncbi:MULTISPECIES: hypothetical protein [Actinotignum]|uniref:hypothetical protein n=1 Tax=Actinotignum TaxID=1653174 RepID=UPI002549EDD9|nr:MULTISPECIES: hypothetical protein [Actinotignum]MDE1536261.1 hypothetical protein [Actinotignum schaalii]MDK7272085.1 hypothetical protein [Actinotignum schaalii]MDY5144841.1 hypothetical protein [Actinotignum timonense]